MARLTPEQAALIDLLERVQVLEKALQHMAAERDVLLRRILRLEAATGVPPMLLVHPERCRRALTANPKRGRIAAP